jgi:UDP-N-acetylglucosamine 4,6-dehydratase/5-epimerase
MGSRGSVIPLFIKQAKTGTITITDENMTRFWITLEEAVQFVLSSLEIMQGGELFIPKIPSMKITDLAKAVAPKVKFKVIGVRPGEKLHESLISRDEASHTYDLGDRYMLKPLQLTTWNESFYQNIEKVPQGFSYTSDTNPHSLSEEEMRGILKHSLV